MPERRVGSWTQKDQDGNDHQMHVYAVRMVSRALLGSSFEAPEEPERYYLTVDGEDHHTRAAFGPDGAQSDAEAMAKAKAYVATFK